MAEEFRISDAFKAMSRLNEDTFDTDDKGIEQLKDFMSDDTSDDFQAIIDADAKTEEDIKDSYVGKVILMCDVCRSLIYKQAEDIVIDDDSDLANVGEECPYCQSPDGFKIVGEVSPYSASTETEGTQTDSDDIKLKEAIHKRNSKVKSIKESLSDLVKVKSKNSHIKESFDKVEVTANGQKIEIKSEPADNDNEKGGAEMIAPIDNTTKDKIDNNEDDYQDVDIEEVDENDFDTLGESYLKRTYENVDSFKTTSGSINGNTLMLEGIITFKSGKKAKTQFVFEKAFLTKSGKLKLLGENKQFAKRKNAFTLTGTLNEKKLTCESLSYDYRAKDAKTGKATRLYGTVTKKSK